MLQSSFRKLLPSLALALVAYSATGCGTKEDSQDTSDSEAWKSVKAEEVQGTVKYCHDGDTCQVRLADGANLTVRLGGIDAPEVSGGSSNKGQPFGRDARDFLSSLVKGKKVTVRKIELDPYGRTVGELFVNGKLVNIQLTEKGLAEAYKWATWKVNKKAYAKAEAAAKSQQLGIWSQESYVSPGKFRSSN